MAIKWISLTQECVLVSSKSNRRSFRTPKIFFEIFVKKFTFRGGRGGGKGQFGKSLHSEFFLGDASLRACKVMRLKIIKETLLLPLNPTYETYKINKGCELGWTITLKLWVGG